MILRLKGETMDEYTYTIFQSLTDDLTGNPITKSTINDYNIRTKVDLHLRF